MEPFVSVDHWYKRQSKAGPNIKYTEKEDTMKKHLIMAVCALTTIGALGACQNTLHGAGEDIENAGEAVQTNVPPKQ